MHARSVFLGFVSLVALAGLAGLASPREATAAAKLSRGEKDRLDKGEVLIDSREVGEHKATLARAIGVIEAPPDAVWAVIDKCARYKEFMPRVVESEELSRKGEIIHCRTVVDLPFPLGSIESEMKCRHRAKGKGRFERRWKGVKGPYHVNHGSWRISPWGAGGEHSERTLVVYTMEVAPKLAIPATIRREAQKMTLPKVIQSLREHVAKESK